MRYLSALILTVGVFSAAILAVFPVFVLFKMVPSPWGILLGMLWLVFYIPAVVAGIDWVTDHI